MKNLILITFLLFINLSLAQEIGKIYKTTQGISIKQVNAVGEIDSDLSSDKLLYEDVSFKIIKSIDENKYLIKILPFKENGKFKDKKIKFNDKYIYKIGGTSSNPIRIPIYFSISNEDFLTTRKLELIDRWDVEAVISPVTIPIKVRFGGEDGMRKFDFTSDINIGLSIGPKISVKNYNFSINALFGISITSIDINQETSSRINKNGFVNKNTKVAALTPSFSAVFDWEKFQCGISIGIDYLQGDFNDNWMYKNSPWLGLGIGYNIIGSPQKKIKKQSSKL